MRLREPLVMLSLAGIPVVACSSVEEAGGAGGGGSTGAGRGGWAGLVDNPPPECSKPVTPPPDAEAITKRGACGYQKGALPAETQGVSRPMGKDIPVETIIVMMMENRSFDHCFQGAVKAGLTDVEVAPAGF